MTSWYYDKMGIKGKRHRVVLLGGWKETERDESFFRTKKSADKWIKLLGLKKENQKYQGGFLF